MSYVEFIGTVFYLGSVWLIAKRNILTWPVGIISVLLYMALFYQIRLYSDTLEQVYYLGASIYGWWIWYRSPRENGLISDVVYSNINKLIVWALVTFIVSLPVGWLMARVHVFLPSIFPDEASFPFLDALTTVMSFSAMWLMARKKVESWVYWIVVDVVGIWLYFAKDVKFISLLYVVLFVMAINGLRMWHKSMQDALSEDRILKANILN
ncbi:MAG: nicotinamide mononucleotide transporter [Anaerolineae bacterium]|nr:nicotinamide mononucleotide transporter [Anaerolineae bacterium]